MADLETCCHEFVANRSSQGRLTNKSVLDLQSHTQRHAKKNVVMKNIFVKLIPALEKKQHRTISSKIVRLHKMQKTFTKNKKEALENLLCDDFDLDITLSAFKPWELCLLS